MSRPIRNRKICNPPKMAGFKPFGMPRCEINSVKLQYDEFESIKLVDYENLPQDLAAERMDISRPTLTRIYNSAQKKIAKAFVECLAIEIEGGNVEFEKEWFKCNKCFKFTDGIRNNEKCIDCESYEINQSTNKTDEIK